MALRFFTDHCISNQIVKALVEEGADVFQLRDHLPLDSPDPLVIRKAQELDCILVSLNGDFADIVSYPPDRYKGIIGLQIRNRPEVTRQIIQRLTDYVRLHPDPGHYAGKLFVVEAYRIRVRG